MCTPRANRQRYRQPGQQQRTRRAQFAQHEQRHAVHRLHGKVAQHLLRQRQRVVARAYAAAGAEVYNLDLEEAAGAAA